MRQTIRLHGKLYDIEGEDLQRAIDAATDIRSQRPVCMCLPSDPLEMYVAKVNGRHVIKRMPDTGHLHDPACASYEAPATVSGITEVDGRAILHDQDTELVTLRLGFSLSKTNSSHAPAAAPTPPDSAKATISRLTMRSTIDYLWDAAQLNRWHPSMAGRRNYSVAWKYVRRATENTYAKRASLSSTLYMPEPFYADRAPDIKDRAHQALARCAHQRSGTQPLSLLFGEVKAITPARAGAHVQIRHAPFLDFYIGQALHEKMQRIFDADLALWNSDTNLHLMLMATVAQNAAGLYELLELALMLTDSGWIPVRSLQDLQLHELLATSQRSFLKGLRFNADEHTRFADALLTDTDRPTAIYLTTGSETPEEQQQIAYECEDSGLAVHFVRGSDVAAAQLPPAKSTRPN